MVAGIEHDFEEFEKKAVIEDRAISLSGRLYQSTIIAGTIIAISIISVAFYVDGYFKNRIKESYQTLPQSEIIRPFDTNNNGNLESNELENLMRNYQLTQRPSIR